MHMLCRPVGIDNNNVIDNDCHHLRYNYVVQQLVTVTVVLDTYYKDTVAVAATSDS